MVNFILKAIINILGIGSNVLRIPLTQRSKFEGWLKVMLAYTLSSRYKNVGIEYPYPRNNKIHADVFANHSYIELKTPNTNYIVNNVPQKKRPITNNITSIIQDINKLRTQANGYDGYIAFVLFPINDNQNYASHINRVDKAIGNPKQISSKIITINNISVLVYVAKV